MRMSGQVRDEYDGSSHRVSVEFVDCNESALELGDIVEILPKARTSFASILSESFPRGKAQVVSFSVYDGGALGIRAVKPTKAGWVRKDSADGWVHMADVKKVGHQDLPPIQRED
jgi:hypothetical protein